MHTLTKEERQLKLVLRVSALTYLVAGLAFALAPGLILRLINLFSGHIHPKPGSHTAQHGKVLAYPGLLHDDDHHRPLLYGAVQYQEE